MEMSLNFRWSVCESDEKWQSSEIYFNVVKTRLSS